MSDINKFSYSSISTYNTCPYKFKKIYIDKISNDNYYLRVGSATHSILEKIFNLVKTANHYKVEFNPEQILEEIKHNIYEKNKLKREKRDINKMLTPNSIQQILNTLNLNSYEDFICEKKFQKEYYIKEHKIILTGYPDLVLTNFDKIIIIDFKTSRVKNGSYYPPDLHQTQIYALLIYYSYLEKDILFPLNDIQSYYYFLRTHTIISNPISLKDIKEIENNILSVIKKILEDKTFPITQNKFCKWCPVFSECENKFNENYLKKEDIKVKMIDLK